jgi:hypothetical protein
MSRRLALLAAAAAILAGPALAQRVEVDPARKTSLDAPIAIRTSAIIASEMSKTDASPIPLFREEHFRFTGQAGETLTAQAATDILFLSVIVLDGARKEVARELVTNGPVKITLPRDGDYLMVVQSSGSKRYGRYELSLKSSAVRAPAPAPLPPPVQVAQGAAPKPAGPAALPPMPAIPGVTNLRVGQTLARPAAKTPATRVELYAFVGEAGAILQAEAAGAGRYGVTLYTPEGAEMLTATGAGEARLAAVLPLDAVYLLAVARQDAAKPYKLSLAAEAPDLHLWGFRSWAGYETLGPDGKALYSTCWVTPGAVMRYNMANGQVQTLTLSRGGAGRWDYLAGGKPSGYAFTTRIEGAKVTRTSEYNTVQTWSLDDPPKPHGAYKGYLCQ